MTINTINSIEYMKDLAHNADLVEWRECYDPRTETAFIGLVAWIGETQHVVWER